MTFDMDRTNRKVDSAVSHKVDDREFTMVSYELWFKLFDAIMSRDVSELGANVYDRLIDKYGLEKATWNG